MREVPSFLYLRPEPVERYCTKLGLFEIGFLYRSYACYLAIKSAIALANESPRRTKNAPLPR